MPRRPRSEPPAEQLPDTEAASSVDRSRATPTDGGASSAGARIGAAVRRTRQGHYTIAELAQRTGISTTMLGLIERGEGNPSIATIVKIADGLGVPTPELVNDALGPEPPGPVVRASERTVFDLPGFRSEQLTPSHHGPYTMFRGVFAPDFVTTANPGFGNRTWFVVTGALEVTIEGRTYRLEQGDAITYDARLRSDVRNVAGTATEFIGVETGSRRALRRPMRRDRGDGSGIA